MMKVELRKLATLLFKMLLVTISLGILHRPCLARFPIYIDDIELAQSPVVVIGYWPKAQFRSHYNEEKNVITHTEAFTKLQITQVLHGNISLGTHKLLITGCVGWDKDGTGVTSATSSEMPGEIDDVTKPSIWFLDISKSWDTADKTEYLHIRTYRCIQYRKYLPVYEVLRRPDRDKAIRACLQSKDGDVVLKALNFVAGGKMPWPFTPDNSKYPDQGYDFSEQMNGKPRPRVVGQLGNLEQIISSCPVKSRGYATALLSEMKGQKVISLLRSLLWSSEDDVRTVAACHLVRYGVVGEAESMVANLHPYPKDSSNSCELIYAIEKSKDRSYVPVLIKYLQTPSSWGNVDELQAPATFARRTLRKFTGFSFPFDVRSSQVAWSQVVKSNPSAPQTKLLQILGSWENPIEITARPILEPNGKMRKTIHPKVLEGEYQVRVSIRNRTDHPVTVRCKPYSIGIDQGRWSYYREDMNDFIVLKAGQVFESIIATPEIEKSSKVIFSYTQSGQNFGYCAWLGDVEAKLGK